MKQIGGDRLPGESFTTAVCVLCAERKTTVHSRLVDKRPHAMMKERLLHCDFGRKERCTFSRFSGRLRSGKEFSLRKPTRVFALFWGGGKGRS